MVTPRTGRARLVACLLAVLVTVTGCGIATPTTDLSRADEPVTLRFTWWGADSRHRITAEVIAEFERRHPDIRVEGQFSDWTGYWSRLATTFAAGDAADVVQMDESYLRTYANRGALFDLDSLGEYLDPTDIPETALAAGRADGVLYAVPIGISAYTLVANLDLFDQYGIPVPDDASWTWADLEELGRQFNEASGGQVGGLDGVGQRGDSLTVWARQNGTDLFDADGRVALPVDVAADYWQYVLELADVGATLPPSLQAELLSAPLDQGALVTGRVALGGYFHAQIGAVSAAMPDTRLALLELPRDPGAADIGTYYKPSMYWSVASSTEHPAEAAIFVDFLTNDPTAAQLLGTDRGIPANPRLLDQIRPSLTAPAQLAVEYNERIADLVGTPPGLTPPGASGLENTMQRYFTDVLFRRLTPREAAQQFVDELTVSVNSAR